MNSHAFVILVGCFASTVLADDFKTINGKEYKDATVSRVETDGIVLRTKGGVSKVYFTELPKDVQERFYYNPAKAVAAQREREQIALQVKQDPRRQAGEHRQLAAVAQHGDDSTTIVVATIIVIVGAIIAIVAVANAKQRREQRALLFKQARGWAATVQQNHALPTVATNIILKPGETAFYSSPSALYETCAVRQYQAAHSGFRVAKGVYIGGTSGRSVSTQQWAKLDTGSLVITNKRLVFDGGSQDRTIPLNKVVTVHNSLTQIELAVEGRQKAMVFEAANPLIASLIIRLCAQVSDPLNLSGDKINITFNE